MKHLVLLMLTLSVAACETDVVKPAPAPAAQAARGGTTASPPLPSYCVGVPQASPKRVVCTNKISVRWTSASNFKVSVDFDPFQVPSPTHPDLGGLPLRARWTLPTATAGENFVFVIPRGDGVYLKQESGEFDGDDQDEGPAVGGRRKAFHWQISNQLTGRYDYSITFHRVLSGVLTHKISCDPRIVDLPQGSFTFLTVDLSGCVATPV